MQTHQFGKDRSQVLAARGQFDSQQLLHRMMPGDFVGQRRNVIHPVNDGDVLVEVEVFAQLFEAGMQVSDVGNRIHHGFAIERQHQSQRRVSCRVLRAEIKRPEILLFRSVHFSEIGNFKRHWKPLER